MSREIGKKIRTAKMRIDMPDGSKWDVPVEVIARSRADNYKDEFGNDIERSLEEDTWPLFEESSYECTDWAANNMNWSEVEKFAVKFEFERPCDYQEGWCNGEKEIIE